MIAVTIENGAPAHEGRAAKTKAEVGQEGEARAQVKPAKTPKPKADGSNKKAGHRAPDAAPRVSR